MEQQINEETTSTAVILLELLKQEKTCLEDELSRFRNPEISERKLAKLERRLARVREEIARAVESQEDRIIDTVEFRVKQAIREAPGLLEEIRRNREYRGMEEVEKIFKSTTKKVLFEVMEKTSKEITKITEREKAISEEIERIRKKLERKAQIKELLAELDELLPQDWQEEKKGPDYSTSLQGTERVRPEDSYHPPNRKRRKPRKSRQQKEQEDRKREESEREQLDMDLEKLKEAMGKANGNGKKPTIRILAPYKKGNKRVGGLRKKWKNLFKRCGFTGEVKTVAIEDLKRTNDTTTPIVMAKGMNSHGADWHPGSFENVFVIYTHVTHFPKRPFADGKNLA